MGAAPSQINLEYWMRLVYECLRGACYGNADTAGLIAFLAGLWVWIAWIGFLVAIAALALIVYVSMKLFALREQEEEAYGPIHIAKEEEVVNQRWAHITALMGSTSQSDWRQAILEADIMLGDMLTKQGYGGSSIGDQLKQVDPADFNTLNDAWEAHKVRNEIAHAGSAFDVSQIMAQRTLGRYERVFREFSAL